MKRAGDAGGDNRRQPNLDDKAASNSGSTARRSVAKRRKRSDSDIESGSSQEDPHLRAESDRLTCERSRCPRSSKDRDDGNSQLVDMSIIHGPSDIIVEGSDLAHGFPYRTLDKSKLEIRIVTLKAGNIDDPIQCALEHVATNKHSRPEYKALSYTWGSPDFVKTISLNGIHVQVRENLWDALRHLRRVDGDLRIWIDAICINQNDIIERNAQVTRMKTIYGRAEEVVVWIGPQKDGSEMAIAFLEAKFHKDAEPFPSEFYTNTEYLSTHDAILALTNRDYWKRVWIIQEIYRAQKLRIQCGHGVLSWTTFSGFFRHLNENWNIPSATRKYRVELRTLGECPAARLTFWGGTRDLGLEELLIVYQSSLSSDPRDKIYSLMGLANRTISRQAPWLMEKSKKWIKVDYSKSPLHLFCTLVYMYPPTSIYIVQWMQLLQEALRIDNPRSDLDNWPALLENSELPLISCKGRYLKVRGESDNDSWYTRGIVSPSICWIPGTETQTVLGCHRNFSASNSKAIPSLDRILTTFTEKDIERLECSQILETWQPLPNQQIQILVANSGHHFFFTRCNISPGMEIVLFQGTDLGLVVSRAGSGDSAVCKVLGRVLVFETNLKNSPQYTAKPPSHAVFREYGSWGNTALTEDLVTLSLREWHTLIW